MDVDNAKISAPAPGQPEPVLPRLRQDLTISQGGPDEDGGPTWLMYDPLKHSYFRIGQIAFTMLPYASSRTTASGLSEASTR
ncbi:MAG: hypothetical protein WC124_12565 [Desulfoplanes sp.]